MLGKSPRSRRRLRKRTKSVSLLLELPKKPGFRSLQSWQSLKKKRTGLTKLFKAITNLLLSQEKRKGITTIRKSRRNEKRPNPKKSRLKLNLQTQC